MSEECTAVANNPASKLHFSSALKYQMPSAINPSMSIFLLISIAALGLSPRIRTFVEQKCNILLKIQLAIHLLLLLPKGEA
jgi:hypothetical protein